MWVKLHADVFTHPKIGRLCRLLPDVSEAAAVGHLASLWTWAMSYAPDGDLSKFDELDIAIGARYLGDASAFVSAITRAGFLDPDESGALSIHDWADYGGRLQEQREAAAENARQWRARKKEEAATAKKPKARPMQLAEHPAPPKPKRLVDMTPFHEQFWPLYPRKVGKHAAAKAWAALDPTPEHVEEILKALKAQIDSDTWTEARFIPHPATWLNGKRWLDEWPSKASHRAREVVL